MSTLGELMEQREELNRKKYELLLYLMEFRKIHGNISEITYRQNSRIDAGYRQGERKEPLKAELRQMNAGLKQRYGLSPRMVQHQIDRYSDDLEKINKQIEDIERQSRVASQPTSQDFSGSFQQGALPCGNRASGLAGQLSGLAQPFSERPQQEPGRDDGPDLDR